MVTYRVTPDLVDLPAYVSHAQIKKLGFTDEGAKHLERACGQCWRVGRFWYVHRSDLERVLAERQVSVS